jgi:hypothetical protein
MIVPTLVSVFDGREFKGHDMKTVINIAISKTEVTVYYADGSHEVFQGCVECQYDQSDGEPCLVIDLSKMPSPLWEYFSRDEVMVD